MATVLVDAENVRRSRWPNVGGDELEQRTRAWAETNGHEILVVWERPGETADDWIARHAREHRPYWLVTSDRELRARAGRSAERVIGGGSFLRELGLR
jgi:predicted RNA-binding protein with PIN domain